MLDIGWSEFLVIGVVALVVIGPKELPAALRTAGRFAARARALAQDFRDGLDDIARESEIKDIHNKIGGDIDNLFDERETTPKKTSASQAAPAAAEVEADAAAEQAELDAAELEEIGDEAAAAPEDTVDDPATEKPHKQPEPGP